MLPQDRKYRATFLRTEGIKFPMMIDRAYASHYLFCCTSKLNNSTSQRVNNYDKAVTTSMLPGQQFADDSAHLSTSLDAIWANRVQVFCVEA